MGKHCTCSDTSLAIFMHFRLPFAACFVSDFLVHIQHYTHTHIQTHIYIHTHTYKPIFGNRFAAFLWFHMHFSTALPRPAPLPHCRKYMTAATCQLRQVLWIFLAASLTRKGKLYSVGKVIKSAARRFPHVAERRK